MDSQEDPIERLRSLEAAARARLTRDRPTRQQLIERCARSETALVVAMEWGSALSKLLSDLQAGERYLQLAAQAETKLGAAVSLCALPASLHGLVEGARSVEAAEFRLTGKRGGQARHRNTEALKEWALNEAQGDKRPDTAIADDLAARLPAEHLDASQDPGRLILNALRKGRGKLKD